MKDIDNRLEDLSNDLVFSCEYKKECSSVRKYIDLLRVCKAIDSVVQSLIIAVIEGKREIHTPRHLVSKIGFNHVPLVDRMKWGYCYPLERIVKDNLYLSKFRDEDDTDRVDEIIISFHDSIKRDHLLETLYNQPEITFQPRKEDFLKYSGETFKKE